MKRSGDVTAAAIVLFFGSGLMVLMAVVMIVGAAVTPLPPEQRAIQFMLPIFYALAAAWGIATGVGILQLRSWARISVIAMSAMTILFAVCGGIGLMLVPMLLKQDPNVPAEAIRVVVFVGLIVLGVPLAIAIWWLLLFTRARVRVEFATRGAATVSSATPGTAIATDLAPAFAAAASAPEMPISIRVIALFILITAPCALMSLPLALRGHLPTIIMGVLVTGWATPTYLVVSVIVQIALSVALLLRRFRAIDGLIAYLLFAVLNGLAFVVSPAQKTFVNALITVQSSAQGMDPEVLRRFTNALMPVIMGVSVLLFAIAFYFLFTRRKAYRAACEARRAAA